MERQNHIKTARQMDRETNGQSFGETETGRL